LDHFRGADLLPLLEALKAHLPADLRVQGAVSGSARISFGRGLPLSGSGSLQLEAPAFATSAETLSAPRAQVRWDGHRLRLLPLQASLARSGASAPARLQLAAAADRSGFRVEASSSALDSGDAAALAHLAGVAWPWPPGVACTANATLALGGAWSALVHVAWSGAARWTAFNFHSGLDAELPLKPLAVTWSPKGAQAEFALATGGLAGALTLPPSAPMQFALRAPKLDAATAWGWLHGAPGGFVERVLGDVGVGGAPAWLGPAEQRQGARGTLRADAFTWPAAIEGNLSAEIGWAPAGGAPSAKSFPITGSFALRRGRLRTATGWRSFERFSGEFRLSGSTAALDHLAWSDGAGPPLLGSGSAHLDDRGRLSFDLKLAAPRRSLHLSIQ